MALPFRTLLSTASLVTVRSTGVAARSLSLLTLAAKMPAERFGHYALAFVLSELARCAADFGLDPVVLRRAEGLSAEEQHPIIRSALAVRLSHATVAGMAVIAILALSFPLDLLLIVAGLQFIAQGMLQLALNWRQVNDSAHQAAPILLGLYGSVIGLAILAYFHPSFGTVPLPLLLAGEAIIATSLLAPLLPLRVTDLISGYRILIPTALPVAGIMFLAFVNTRTDALLVGTLLGAESAGRYLYLARWVDFAPMLASGVALPLVGKLRGFDARRHFHLPVAFGCLLVAVPFALVQTAALLNPSYADDLPLRMLLATAAACRVGLAVTTTLLLAQWRDRALMRMALFTTMLVPLLTWILGSHFGAKGVAAAVLTAEAGNFLLQSILLLGGRKLPRSELPGRRNE